jgi:hypothetical protein
LESLQARLTQWREEHGGRGRRIPEPLWIEAAEVAREEGVETTARHLRLNRDKLKERSGEGTTCQPDECRCDNKRSEFVEVALPHSLNTGRAMFMFTNGRGDELCIIDMAGCIDIRTLLGDFWDRR